MKKQIFIGSCGKKQIKIRGNQLLDSSISLSPL
ncbi:unnamed protein product, partial [Onchocerca ochengi]|uniref:Uncharacterized protein n=1 Tax=Onchocerca ochengi TaxID=42157 RepID=A0A182EX58_ONCOC